MDARDNSIIAQVAVKAAAALYQGSQAPGNALEAAEMFESWIHDCALRNGLPPTAAEKGGSGATTGESPVPSSSQEPFPPRCPACSGPMWDNRAGKRNPKAPDAKCKDKSCGKGVWLTPYQP